MTTIMTTFYVTVLIFVSFSSTVITELWLPPTNNLERNEEIAGDLMSLPFLCCTILSPIVGFIVDKKGQRIKFMMIGCFLVFFGLLSILFFYPVYTMLLIGVGYAVFASTIWPTITFIVSEDKLVFTVYQT
jgi:MFS family permease